jgi:hypothetical protein
MREQNPPKSKEEAEQQRLAAIGRARFQGIHGRQQKHMAAKMEEQQANLEMQQQQLQQLQQQVAMAAARCLLGAATKWVPHPPRLDTI